MHGEKDVNALEVCCIHGGETASGSPLVRHSDRLSGSGFALGPSEFQVTLSF